MKKLIFLLLYFLSPILPILIVFNSNQGKYLDETDLLIALILGACAYTWLVCEFVISARPKFIEKYFGMDKIYRFHGWMALVAIASVYIHEEYVGFGARVVRGYGNLALNIFVAITAITLVFMVDTLLMKIKPLQKIISFLRLILKKINIQKYEYFVAIHSLTVVALIYMFLHVYNTSSAKASSAVRMVYLAYFVFGMGFYLYHKIFKFILLSKNKYKVTEILEESRNMWTLKLVPQSGNIFKYKPGQFGFFRIMGKKVKPQEHPFSISSQPINRDYLSVTVKNLGDFTSKMNDIELGDTVYVDGPYGKFSYLENPKEESTVLIAGGVGITPMISMLRYMANADKSRKVTLVWGVRNREELICSSEFESIKNEMKNLSVVIVMSNDESWDGEKGYINKDKLEKMLSDSKYDLSKTGFYICGPGPMLEIVLKSLRALSIDKKLVHYEKFSL